MGTSVGQWVAIESGWRAFLPAPLPRGLPLPAGIVRRIGEVRTSLGRLAEGLRALPSPELFLRPFQTREAVLSSRIEGTQTTLEQALVHDASDVVEAHGAEDLEVLNYGRALRIGDAALAAGRPLTIYLLRELHRELLRGVRGSDKKPGEFRDRQVWIGDPARGRDPTAARFVPPPPLDVEPCLHELDAYLADRTSDEGLVRVALAHYQLETIHPFLDGNGRVGRLLLALQMAWEGLLDCACLFVSPSLERQRQRYYDELLRVSVAGDYLGWIAFFLEVVAESATDTLQRLQRLRQLQEQFLAKLRQEASPKPALLVPYLFERPYLTASMVMQHLGCESKPAQAAVERLVRAGILVPTTASGARGRGRPAQWYACPEILAVLRE